MRTRRIELEIEKVIEDAFVNAGVAEKAAVPASRLATHAICEYLIGCRVKFGGLNRRTYRDRAVYDAAISGNSEGLAAAENLTSRQIRNIVRNQMKRRRSNANKIQRPELGQPNKDNREG
jgi:hypothetical protein